MARLENQMMPSGWVFLHLKASSTRNVSSQTTSVGGLGRCLTLDHPSQAMKMEGLRPSG